MALQLASLETYYALGIANMKAALEVRDVTSLKDYTLAQNELVKTVGEKLTADVKAVTELTGEFNTEAQKIARESVVSLNSAAA